jgi:hypothetical protein
LYRKLRGDRKSPVNPHFGQFVWAKIRRPNHQEGERVVLSSVVAQFRIDGATYSNGVFGVLAINNGLIAVSYYTTQSRYCVHFKGGCTGSTVSGVLLIHSFIHSFIYRR